MKSRDKLIEELKARAQAMRDAAGLCEEMCKDDGIEKDILLIDGAVALEQAITQLKADAEEIKSLRFDVKAQPTYKAIVEKAQKTGSTAEIVSMIRAAEIGQKNEILKAENDKLRGEVESLKASLEEAQADAEHTRAQKEWRAQAVIDAEAERDTLQKQNAELREALEFIAFNMSLSMPPEYNNETAWYHERAMEAIGTAARALHNHPQPKKEECPECGGSGTKIQTKGFPEKYSQPVVQPCPKCGGNDE